ncbi:4-(cytidine 5'-diphospho)-2-C-methyl-D-erythritol kinase [Gemmobacter nectariphilus]|uniref:4-(cytidine 5'-diphospho)-2-C-methyl-D-erythritol kinase n=1 Tax=Gemmobacter nectariphilus TaxID=220343 RepID=UPI000403CCB0|nr:4-(cytidine 5'-diphospho)-2-C-methyl-D-erythritol kinase [Gemmobacter nectariphilus]
MTLQVFAPAKVNLTLHVTGRRDDGYHLLDSLVAFAGVGDVLTLEPADDLSLRITGPEGAGLAAEPDNLVLRAAAALEAPGQGARITLDKRLPVASGIGGGSADAAAALHGLSRLWSCPLPDPARSLALGADVPVCLQGQTCRMSGVGDHLAPVPPLPPVWAVLANPRIPVPTPAVFCALTSRSNPAMPADLPCWANAPDLARWLAAQRNDLEPAAIAVAPQIAMVLDRLASLPGTLLARMSGSGATCFALFGTPASAEVAATALRQTHPDWWIAAAPLGDANRTTV